MSSFFDEASLVMIPSGYKDQKVYSVKPLDGSGDLTFSRASSATRVASNGLIEKVRTNLALRSQSFATSAVWSTVSGTITDNAGTAPDGTNTASKIVAGNSDPYVYQSLTLTGSVAVSCYVKGVGSSIGKIARILVGSSMTDVTMDGTWQRISVAHTAAGAELYGLEIPNPAVTSDEVLMWGFQVETGDIATDYIATTSAAVSVGPVSGLPRLDYLNSTCPRLLLEPQRTNVALNSESVASDTNVGYTVTANNTASPDGYVNADRILEDTGTLHLIQKEFTVGSTTDSYAVSFFVKANGRTSGQILYGLNGAPFSAVGAIFNLSNGTITAASGSSGATAGSSKIESYGSGWYRVSVSGVIGTAGTHYVRMYNDNGGAAGDPTKGFFIYGFQAELGAYATSYIPTLGTSVTRVADAASKTGISSLIGQTEGTLFAEFDFVSGETANYALLHQAAFSTYIFINQGVSGTIFGQIQPFGVSFSAAKPNGRYKCALAYKSGDSAFFVNGVQVGTTNTTTFTPATMDIFNFTADPHTNSNYQALVFKTRLTNAQLAELTA
jgi:hypothetical protein